MRRSAGTAGSNAGAGRDLEDAEELLNTAAHVIPVTLGVTALCAELSDGTLVRVGTKINRPAERSVLPITRVFLDAPVSATTRARKALERADKVLLGPGCLHTSGLPYLLVAGIRDAELVFDCNVMT